jgi:hypothetical protein
MSGCHKSRTSILISCDAVVGETVVEEGPILDVRPNNLSPEIEKRAGDFIFHINGIWNHRHLFYA